MTLSAHQTASALSAVQRLNDLICEAVAVAGDLGCPAGVLFAPLSGHITAPQFETLIDRLVAGGRLTRSGHLLRVVPRPAPLGANETTQAMLDCLSGSRSVQRRLSIQKGGAL